MGVSRAVPVPGGSGGVRPGLCPCPPGSAPAPRCACGEQVTGHCTWCERRRDGREVRWHDGSLARVWEGRGKRVDSPGIRAEPGEKRGGDSRPATIVRKNSGAPRRTRRCVSVRPWVRVSVRPGLGRPSDGAVPWSPAGGLLLREEDAAAGPDVVMRESRSLPGARPDRGCCPAPRGVLRPLWMCAWGGLAEPSSGKAPCRSDSVCAKSVVLGDRKGDLLSGPGVAMLCKRPIRSVAGLCLKSATSSNEISHVKCAKFGKWGWLHIHLTFTT
ncbi:uncharacterized protein [Notamacropus eugenii]|uniref:uncharacterized protein n=1 Tax=Notamacropus eugenii TaxID=9315 RepID=UPI003B673EC4